jgi:hypothetical protein
MRVTDLTWFEFATILAALTVVGWVVKLFIFGGV